MDFTELYVAHQHTARRAAQDVLRNQADVADVDDVVQETFERLLRSIRNGGGPTVSVSGYVRRMARNTAIRQRQRQRRGRTLEEFATRLDRVCRADQRIDDQVVDRHEVIRIMSSVSVPTRVLLWATVAEGRDLADVSRGASTTPSALAAQLYRARLSMRKGCGRSVSPPSLLD